MRDLLYWARTMTVLLLVVGGGTAMPRTVGAQSGVQYRDPQGRFTFTVPSGWVTPPQRSTNAALFADSPQQPGKVLSVGEVSSEGGTLDAVILHIAPVIIDHSPAYQPDPAGLRDLIVGGEPAKQFAFQAKTSPDDIPYALALTVVLHNGTAYTVSYFTLPPDPDSATAPPLQAVLDSWQFTDHETTIGVGWRRYRDAVGVEGETHAVRRRFLLDTEPAAQLGDLLFRIVLHRHSSVAASLTLPECWPCPSHADRPHCHCYRTRTPTRVIVRLATRDDSFALLRQHLRHRSDVNLERVRERPIEKNL